MLFVALFFVYADCLLIRIALIHRLNAPFSASGMLLYCRQVITNADYKCCYLPCFRLCGL